MQHGAFSLYVFAKLHTRTMEGCHETPSRHTHNLVIPGPFVFGERPAKFNCAVPRAMYDGCGLLAGCSKPEKKSKILGTKPDPGQTQLYEVAPPMSCKLILTCVVLKTTLLSANASIEIQARQER